MTNNQPDLDHLAALAAAATPGPWHLTDSSAIVAPLTADEIADVWEPTAASRNGEFIEAAREALPALVDEVRRLRAQVVDFSGRVNELESKLCDCEPVREHDDYKRPAFYQHEPHCPVTELDHAAAPAARSAAV